MIDALESLVKLQADMPAWLEKADFLKHAARLRYNEFAKLSENLAITPALRKKNGSTESMRPQDDGEKIPTPEGTPGAEAAPPLSASLGGALQSTAPTTPQTVGKINIDPRNRHLFREVRELRRKRKNPSLKDGQSGPQKARSRMSLVIYYDSSIQEGFEALVRSISSARSVLRKARTAVSLRPKLTVLPQEEESQGGESVYAYRMPTIPRRNSPAGTKTGLELYDQLDQNFEAAQTLCEVGAHQALRDGDCFEELDDVKSHLESCTKLIETEVHILQQQANQMQILRASTSRVPEVAALGDKPPDHGAVPYAEDPSAIQVDGAIEVDDDDAASMIVDLSDLPGRRQYSSKHGAKSRGSSSSAHKEAQQTEPQPAEKDKFGDWGRAGKDVPIEAGIAAAAGIAVGAVSTDEPEIDFAALRSSVPRRRQEVSPSVAIPAPNEEPEFDLAAMRKSALNRRPQEAPSSAAKAPSAEEPEFDLVAMRKSALKRRGADPPTETAGHDVRPAVNMTADPASLLSRDNSDEKSSLVVDHAHEMRDVMRAQVA